MKKKLDIYSPSMTAPKNGLLVRRFTQCFVFLILILFTVAVIVGTASCNSKDDDTSSNKVPQKKELAHSILFVLGKDFYQYSELFTDLSDIYDSESLKENLHILSYNDMTAKTKQPRLSMISDRLATKPVEALISIGIPEGGARILRTVKETYPSLHIFSLLPVEEILPLEAYSDIVVDFELPDSFTKADRAVNIPAHDVQMLVLCVLTAIEQIDEIPEQGPFQRFARAVATTSAVLESYGITAWGGVPYILQPYKDPELNIRSYNYLILSSPSVGEQEQGIDTDTGAAGSGEQGSATGEKQ